MSHRGIEDDNLVGQGSLDMAPLTQKTYPIAPPPKLRAGRPVLRRSEEQRNPHSLGRGVLNVTSS